MSASRGRVRASSYVLIVFFENIQAANIVFFSEFQLLVANVSRLLKEKLASISL